jgi:hypothetical protein
MYGTEFPFSTELADLCEQHEDSELDFIIDGMCAKYIMIGKAICVGSDGDSVGGPTRMNFVGTRHKEIHDQIEKFIGRPVACDYYFVGHYS